MVISLSSDSQILQQKEKVENSITVESLCRTQKVESGQMKESTCCFLISTAKGGRGKTEFSAKMTIVVVEWIFPWWSDYYIGPYL